MAVKGSANSLSRNDYPLKYQKFWLILSGILVGGIVFGSLYPLALRSEFLAMDKIHHAIAYGTLTGWLLLIFHGRKAWLKIVVFALLLGGSLEIAQSFTDFRISEWLDIAANTLGVMLGSIVALTPLRFILVEVERIFESVSS